jgi:hypothetical protein
MPDGNPIHIIEREDEVPTYIWDPKNEKYTKKKLKADFIKENQNKNKRIVNSIKGGIKDTGSITRSYWLREEVINSIVSIFDITIYSFMTYIDSLYQVDRFINTPDFKGKQSEGHEEKFGKGHVIFIVNNSVHFTYLKTNIQGYDNNILKCLGLDEQEVTSSSKSSSSLSSNSKNVIKLILSNSSKVVVLMSYGSGNLPIQKELIDFLNSSDKIFLNASQCKAGKIEQLYNVIQLKIVSDFKEVGGKPEPIYLMFELIADQSRSFSFKIEGNKYEDKTKAMS